MGIKDMAEKRQQAEIANEADSRWNQYMILQIAVLCSFLLVLIPPLAVVFIIVIFVAAIVLAIIILGFIKRCSASLRELI